MKKIQKKITYKEFIQNIIDTRGQWNIPEGEYYEKHHIVPACLGGLGDCKNKRFNKYSHHYNCIWLYPQEHFIAHKLLALENQDNNTLFYAFWAMCTIYNEANQQRYKITATEYASLKKQFHIKYSGKNNPLYGTHLTVEQKQYLSELNKGRYVGNIYIYHKDYGTKSIKKDKLKEFLKKGWMLGNGQAGLKKVSEDTKKKISENTKLGMKKWKEENSEEYIKYCKHISECNKGRKQTEEAKQKISKANSGKNNGMYKNGLSTKEYLEAHHKPIKPIICIELNKIYTTANDAEKDLHIGHSHIIRCCKHRFGFKSAGGYHWEYLDNYNKNNV